MKSDSPLDYAVFQLSPRRSRCELFVSHNGNTEKLASGLIKPFVAHLKVAEEQVASAVQSIKLEVGTNKNAETWFTKGTLERFVRFVSTPEVLEMANTFGAEMSQLEAARRIYSQGAEDQPSGMGGGGSGITAATDATKKELLRAIDVRLTAVQQDLTAACSRAAAAGFSLDAVSELRMFAEQFGAHRLNEACSKFISLGEKRPQLLNPWKAEEDDQAVRSSYGSDMSIDEEPTTPEQRPFGSCVSGRATQPLQQECHQLSQPKPSMLQQPKLSSDLQSRGRESSIDTDDKNKEHNVIVENDNREDNASGQAEITRTSQPARRLSVQDRINMFENKQKESSGSGGKPVVTKSVELRRLPSDVSSAAPVVEKAVLRRWSGSSDMSIDLSGEKKDTESPLCTPSSVSETKCVEGKALTANEIASYGILGSRSFSSVSDSALKDQAEAPSRVTVASTKEEVVAAKHLIVPSSKSGDVSETSRSKSNFGTVGNHLWRDQSRVKIESNTTFGRTEDNGVNNQENSDTGQFQSFSEDKTDKTIMENQEKPKGPVDGVDLNLTKRPSASRKQALGLKDQGCLTLDMQASLSKEGHASAWYSHQPVQVEFPQQKEDFNSQIQSVQQSGAKLPQKAFVGEEEAEKRGSTSSEKPLSSSASKGEDFGSEMMKVKKQASAREFMNRSQGRRDESSPVSGIGKNIFSNKMLSGSQEGFGLVSTPPSEQVLRVRQSKGNQELNDELKMKANELEKLFAEHKLRVPGDQSTSTRRGKSNDTQSESAPSSSSAKPVAAVTTTQWPDNYMIIEPSVSSGDMDKLSASPPQKAVNSQYFSDALTKNFAELSFADGSRGKFYEKYMQKRDAKLREEWSSKRADKEAKLKAMHDRLEQSRAEMKARFSGSDDRRGSVLSAHLRAERLRSFNTRSIVRREQQHLDFGQSDDDEDVSEFPERKDYDEDRPVNGVYIGDDNSRSISKKPLPTKSLSSSTPRTLAIPASRSAIKAANTSSGKRRMQSENPLAQSVPNFSELRKENTKPSSVASKTTRPQLRNYARSKSNNDDTSLFKEEKSRRSQSLRKSSANPGESVSAEGVVLAPLKFDKEDTEQSIIDKFSKSAHSKLLLKKGTGPDSGARAMIVKQKASMESVTINDEQIYDNIGLGPENSVVMDKDEEEEKIEMRTEGHANLDDGEPRLSHESEKLANSGSEDGEIVRSSQMDLSLPAQLPVIGSSGFHPVDHMHDSPGESPVSWNSRIHHPFSYSHEMSDVDASVDSPVGSPASWNSHSLSQTDTDAARMRKKWGTAHKPMLVAHSSHNQTRKDMTRGFKRLLKFGRKSRGTDSLVDWISATTSEGDDDTEDGRDLSNRSSEDLRKSRMGFSQGHPSDDSFNEHEFFTDQVQSLQSSIPAPPANFKLREDHLSGSSIKAPRSFFSLSSFRSKGSDSKPR